MNATLEVLEVFDTRNFDLQTFKPIPGSGEPHSCDHCGKTHEVYCKLSDGQIVGTTCCRKQVYDKNDLTTTKGLKRLAIVREVERLAKGIFNSLNLQDKQSLNNDIQEKSELLCEMLDTPFIIPCMIETQVWNLIDEHFITNKSSN